MVAWWRNVRAGCEEWSALRVAMLCWHHVSSHFRRTHFLDCIKKSGMTAGMSVVPRMLGALFNFDASESRP